MFSIVAPIRIFLLSRFCLISLNTTAQHSDLPHIDKVSKQLFVNN